MAFSGGVSPSSLRPDTYQLILQQGDPVRNFPYPPPGDAPCRNWASPRDSKSRHGMCVREDFVKCDRTWFAWSECFGPRTD